LSKQKRTFTSKVGRHSHTWHSLCTQSDSRTDRIRTKLDFCDNRGRTRQCPLAQTRIGRDGWRHRWTPFQPLNTPVDCCSLFDVFSVSNLETARLQGSYSTSLKIGLGCQLSWMAVDGALKTLLVA
jgi:hypothetical protein